MALTPETGTGLVDANSFVPITFAEQFFADRINEKWIAASVDQRTSWLIAASEWLSGKFQWKSTKLNELQALAFPRVQWDDVPRPVQLATCQLVALQANGAVFYSQPQTTTTGVIEKVKAGSVEAVFHEPSTSGDASATDDSLQWLEDMLREFICVPSRELAILGVPRC